MAHRVIENEGDLIDLGRFYPVPGHEGRLEISKSGQVKSCTRRVPSRYGSSRLLGSKVLRPFKTNHGYFAIQIRREGKRQNVLVHRMLAEAFIANPHGKPHVNHIDGDKSNNSLSNLEWVTHAENMKHASRMGLMRSSSGPGEQSPASKLTWVKVAEIRRLLAQGLSHQQIAKMYAVSKGAIGYIARNETWRVS